MTSTLEWDGWWFSIKASEIRVRPAPGNRQGYFRDLVFPHYSEGETVLLLIEDLMGLVLAGAAIRGYLFRYNIGIDSQKRNESDVVWNRRAPKYWIDFSGFRPVRRDYHDPEYNPWIK